MGQVTMVVFNEDDNEWIGVIPEYLGCIASGETFLETVDTLREVLKVYEEEEIKPHQHKLAGEQLKSAWISDDRGKTWRVTSYTV